jgi:hypothetical protein
VSVVDDPHRASSSARSRLLVLFLSREGSKGRARDAASGDFPTRGAWRGPSVAYLLLVQSDMRRNWTRRLSSYLGTLRRRRIVVAGSVIALVVVLAVVISAAIDIPLRQRLEARINANLKGYTVRLGAVDFHPIGFSLELIDAVIVQDANPDPPVARIPKFTASVHWKAIIFGRLVGDVLIERPAVHVDLRHLRREITDDTPVKDRGWQEALEAIYPLKINQFKVVDGQLTYVDQGPFKPLELHEVNFEATNIRNVRSRARTYPSEVALTARVFEQGRLDVAGHADFLADPHPGVRGRITLDGLDLAYLQPITSRYNLRVDRGAIGMVGDVEFAPSIKVVDIHSVRVDGLRADYVHTARTKQDEKARVATATRTVREASDAPGTLYRIQRLEVKQSTFGFVNQAAARPFRLYVTDADILLTGLSNHSKEGEAEIRLTGRFMQSGPARVRARFRPDPKAPTLDLRLQIEDTDLTTLNDVLAAYGKFDVAAGRFSFYSEIRVRDRQIRGYLKPLFQDMEVYDPRQDGDKNVFRKLYEKVMDGLASLLENRTRDEVATRTEIAGRLDNPNVSMLEAVGGLVRNAFIKAILPGFERELGRAARSRRT